VIEQRGMHDRILVAASDDALVQRFRRVSQGLVATSAGFGEATRFWLAARLRVSRLLSPPFDALQVPQRHRSLTVVDRHFVQAAHARGIHVHVWTIDQPERMRRLLELGVNGLMSDHPDRLVQVVKGWAGSGARF
jgi:glycerophosphoryl diester phosphodiesterase